MQEPKPIKPTLGKQRTTAAGPHLLGRSSGTPYYQMQLDNRLTNLKPRSGHTQRRNISK